jgi:hypothetical protein
MIAAGWNCAECLTFNGEEHSPRDRCRSCNEPRRSLGLDIEAYMRRMRLLEDNLTAAQEAGSRAVRELQTIKSRLREMRTTYERNAHAQEWARFIEAGS